MPKRLFYGWWIVGVALVGECCGHASLVVYTFSCFLKPLARSFGANRGQAALALTLANLGLACSAPLVGRLADRLGARRVIMGAVLACAGAIAAISRMPPPLWHVYAAFALAGMIGAAAGPVTYRRIVVNWFDRRRGLALGLASLGLGLGATVMPLVAQALIDRVGWRGAYLGLAAIPLVVALPVVALFLRESPADLGLSADGSAGPGRVAAATEAEGATLAEAARTGTFWQLCFIFAAAAACVVGASLHLVAMLTDQGTPTGSAAATASLFGLATIVGRVLAGYLIDVVAASRLLALLLAGSTLGLAILWRGAGGAPAGALLLGLGLGAETDVMPFLVSRYFGLRSMGAIFGCAYSAHVVGAAAGGYLMGAGFDATGSYRLPLAVAGALLLLAAAASGTLRSYRTAAAAAPLNQSPATPAPHG